MDKDKQNTEGLSNTDRVKIHLHYLDHFIRVEQNEELQSEKIIKFFVGLFTGIIAILTLVVKLEIFSHFLNEILFTSLFILFLFGLLVYLRVIWSDRIIKKHRTLWRVSFEEIKNMEPFLENYDKKMETMKDEKFCLLFRAFKGTLPQIIIFIDSLIAFLLVCVVSNMLNCSLICTIIISFLAFVFVFIMLLWWFRHLKSDLVEKKVKNIK